jgi:hypothetical protein
MYSAYYDTFLSVTALTLCGEGSHVRGEERILLWWMRHPNITQSPWPVNTGEGLELRVWCALTRSLRPPNVNAWGSMSNSATAGWVPLASFSDLLCSSLPPFVCEDNNCNHPQWWKNEFSIRKVLSLERTQSIIQMFVIWKTRDLEFCSP